MRVAILMGITYSGASITELPLCKNDLSAIKKIIDATGLYQEQLILDDTYSKAHDALEKLTEFIEELEKKEEEIEEVFVYYTGHGGIFDNDFYFGWNDYSPSSPASTSIVNSQFDDLIRRLQAKLTVKFIDSCHSGMPYVKEMNPLTFKDCFFCFSCRNNQSSGFDEGYSSFTHSIFEAIQKSLVNKKIRYRDIVNSITDKFISQTDKDEDQRPFFVTQGTNTNVFCEVNENLINVMNQILDTDKKEQCEIEKSQENDPYAIYNKIIKKLDDEFMNGTQIKELSSKILDTSNKIELTDELKKLNFDIEVSSGKIDDSIPCFKQLCYFVDRDCSKYFVNIKYNREMKTVKKQKENPFMKSLGLSAFALDSLISPTYEWVEEPVEIPIDFTINNNLEYDYIKIKLISNCKCITNKEIIFIPFYNNNSILLAFNKIKYSYSGIEETAPIFTPWESIETNAEELESVILSKINSFQKNEAETIIKYLEKNK